MITIIDYGMGNLRSVEKIFHRLNIPAKITSLPSEILKAERLLLPGVGHFATGIKKLNESGIKDILKQRVLSDKVPILGICLGMQLMTNFSEEGDIEGLGWIEANTYKFNFEKGKLKTPHMGWNGVEVKKQTVLSQSVDSSNLFYFVHSYYVKCKHDSDILFETTYGHSFVSSFERGNIVGMQFHPEKSYKSGMQLIQNFLKK